MLTVTATCDHEQHPIMNSLSHLLIVLTAQWILENWRRHWIKRGKWVHT